jgi:transcription initiation factor TFIIIB Brf1 subunit/transcription initiation factor TFIIB
LYVAEYVEDMYKHFREKETVTSPTYMAAQPQINESFRAILIDWLALVTFSFKYEKDTLYLAVDIIDRFLAKKKVRKSDLQLVGAAAFFVASKYEEIYPMYLEKLRYLCDEVYSDGDFLNMETRILKTLNYQVTVPTGNTFLPRFLKAAHANEEVSNIANYLLMESLQNYNLLEYYPSELAAASVMVARDTVGCHAWSHTLCKYTGYKSEEVKVIANAVLLERANMPDSLLAIKKQYDSVSNVEFKQAI